MNLTDFEWICIIIYCAFSYGYISEAVDGESKYNKDNKDNKNNETHIILLFLGYLMILCISPFYFPVVFGRDVFTYMYNGKLNKK